MLYAGGSWLPNATWTALTRTLCDLAGADPASAAVAACAPTVLRATVAFSDACPPGDLVDVVRSRHARAPARINSFQ